MHRKKTTRTLMDISMLFYIISAATVFLVGFVPNDVEGLSTMGMVIGIGFWAGLILGSLFFFFAWNTARRSDEYQKLKTTTKPGVISFGKTRYGLIADCSFVVFLILTIIGNTVVRFPDIVMMVCLFIVLYAFYMHFMFNGRVYRYITNNKKKKEKGNEKN